jgi:hypothetical protein
MDRVRALKGKNWIALFLIIAAFIGMILWYGPTDNWSWDPSFYYAQLRSPIIENDLDFRNETKTSGIVTPVTVTGLQGSPWPIGPSIFWSPFFLLAHIFMLIVDPAKATGFSSPYIALVSFGSALYGLAGVLVLYRLCRNFGGKYISIITVLLCFAATPLFYYIYHQTMMAHSTGLLVSALMFLFYVLLTVNQMNRKWSGLIFGVLLGLNFLMRWAGLLFVVFPITYYASQIIKAYRRKDSTELRFLTVQIIVAIISFGLTISPQLALWQRLYGNFLIVPQGSEAFVEGILPINTLKVIFDTNRGLLFWCPFVLIGMLGIFRIPNLEIRLSSAVCIILQIIIIGYRVDWFSGGGFGARYFVELLPLVAVGFVCLTQGYSEKPVWQVGLSVLAFALIVHQSVLMYAVEQTANGWLDIQGYLKGRPLGLSWQIKSFLNLMKDPRLWLVPRSFINEQRQAILVNLIDGVRDYRAYVIPGVAAVLTPVAAIAGLWISKYKDKMQLPVILTGVVVVMVAWSIYIMLVG